MSNHKNSTANLSDVELRDQGNRLFSRKRFDDAIGCYTNAIVSANWATGWDGGWVSHTPYKQIDHNVQVAFVFRSRQI